MDTKRPNLAVERAFNNPQFMIGTDLETGRRFLAIPVSNGLADMLAFFSLSEREYERGLASLAALLPIAEACRRGENLDRIVHWPFREPPGDLLG